MRGDSTEILSQDYCFRDFIERHGELEKKSNKSVRIPSRYYITHTITLQSILFNADGGLGARTGAEASVWARDASGADAGTHSSPTTRHGRPRWNIVVGK